MSDEPGSAPRSPRPRSSGSGPAARTGPLAKGPAAFRTISEASAELGVPQHVLRFWETRFGFISPTKRAGGRRFYRPQDLDVLRGVRTLLQDEGYTIKGVQKLHREGGLKRLLAAAGVGEVAASWPAEAAATPPDDEPPSAPTLSQLSAGAATTGAEDAGEDGPETLDLFGDAPQPPPRPAAPPAPPEPLAVRAGRPVLDDGARARLTEVLDDLQTTKAEIDALLQG